MGIPGRIWHEERQLMLKKIVVLLILVQPMFAWAESGIKETKKENGTTEFTMSALDAVKIAGNMVYAGD